MATKAQKQQFRDDMQLAGYAPEDYSGRNWYEGPAVMADRNELQDIIRCTNVRLMWDQLGKTGIVVYPL